ncbi:hypothetical protein DY000_02022017 [Brassica cretica]|uniref:Uncharacterized protein n=1 Tax=Brassica cretica TaxID=69181 RepID=A0ABQ7E175_BRACR|nr:hypothetical protein DY000_02022017 [Brassica cretica]
MRLSPCQNTDIRALQLTPFHRHRLITITISRLGDYSISSWADDSHHESFTVDTALPEMQSDEYDEDYHREKNIEYRGLTMDVIYHGFYPLSAMFEVSQHPVAEVMSVLLKRGQSASRKEAVQEMKDCRPMKQNWCRSTVMPEYGLSIFYDRLKPISNQKLPEYAWTTKNPIYVIYKPLLLATLAKLSLIHRSRLGEKGGTPSESFWNSFRVLLELLWYKHMSTRSSKGIWLLLVEPLDLERVIHKSKRVVDTLQAAIDNVEIQASIDTIHPASIDTVHPTSIDTVHPTSIDTVHPMSIDTVHPTSIDTVHPTLIDTVHPTSIDTVHPTSIDTVQPTSIDMIQPVSENTVHYDTVHYCTVYRGTIHLVIWLWDVGASIEEQTRMHGFGSYPLIDVRDSSVAT